MQYRRSTVNRASGRVRSTRRIDRAEFVCVLMNTRMIVVLPSFNADQLPCPPVFHTRHSHGIVKRGQGRNSFPFWSTRSDSSGFDVIRRPAAMCARNSSPSRIFFLLIPIIRPVLCTNSCIKQSKTIFR